MWWQNVSSSRRQRNVPLCDAGKGLLSLESLSPLRRFDLVAFSLSFENDYPNILRILSLGKIPYLSEDREELHPFVMAGGITVFLNPEPLAPFLIFSSGGSRGDPGRIPGGFPRDQGPFCGPARPQGSCPCREVALRSVAFTASAITRTGRFNPENALDPERLKKSRFSGQVCRNAGRTCTLLTPESEFADRVLIELGGAAPVPAGSVLPGTFTGLPSP